MSDSEESVFEDGVSSDFEPEPVKPKAKAAPAKKAPAAPKPKAKAAPKKQTQTTLKTMATKKAAAPKKRVVESDDEDSDMGGGMVSAKDDDSLLADTPPPKKQKKALAAKRAATKPVEEDETDGFAVDNEDITIDGAADPRSAKKGGNNTDKYQKLTQLEHIIKRPDTYIGSVERTEKTSWVFNSETEQIESREISYVPGLYKIFDEILVNAADNKQRDSSMDEIRVWIDREKGEIAVQNNGRGIPIEMHDKEKIYIPEMIFGHLLTGSNYDDDEQKVTGGRNGYGAKLCNVFSTKFMLETVDTNQKKKYMQTWTKNMSVMEKAKITSHSRGKDYTKITFYPDFARFNMEGMDDDFEALAKRRVYDLAGACQGVKVFLNEQRIKVTKFKQYMEMYTKAIKRESLIDGSAATEKEVILTDSPHDRWEIGFAVSDGSFQQVSFVNSIATTSGGTHVNYIADQIVNKLLDIVNKKNKKGIQLKPAQIRNHIFLFVNAQIVNPAFNSQTKEQLTTKPSQFGSKCILSEKFLTAISKTEAVANIIHFAQQKADKAMAKTDGNRRTRMSNSKLTDANKAGTKDGYKCTLILTEGDSASLLALAGRAVVNPDLFGVFPLRGKMLNVRDASHDAIMKNQEIVNIKKFVGLQHKKDYTDTKSLRYGHIMIMTDQDHDGSHIKGLLINFLQVQFPSLLKLPGFLLEFITPIVKVWKGDPKRPKNKRDFFTMPEYEAWRQLPGNSKGWDHKYYKGLGTSDTRDAEIYFADLDKHLKEFHTMKEHETELIDLAFSKKKADDRKMWLQNYQPGTFLDMSGKEKISYDDFINKELILFSMADNYRSLPSIVDGFKPTQRKVLYTAFRRNLKKDVKVVELAGSVSGLTAYSYGEASMQQTIVGLAQNFVGSNNINCLEPSGNFGSRLQGGSDAASARYIYTRLSPFARRIFHASDEPLLTYNTDDGKTIEPETYIPILPMILVNGADGIGTGWSTSIPNYNPEEIVENLRRRMRGSSKEDFKPMNPWFRGWNGEIEDIGGSRFRSSGQITQTGDNEVEITELPVRLWTQDFKDRLEEIIKAEKIPSFVKDYTEYNTPEKVHFVIKLEDKCMKAALEKGLEEQFRLSKTMATSNLVAFDGQGRIHKYETPLDIMEEFYHIRLNFYEKRKQYLLSEMQKELDKLSNQSRFVKMIIDGKLTVSKKKKLVLVAELKKLNFKPIPKIVEAKKQGEYEDALEDDNDDEEVEVGANDYDYLLGMAIWSLTQERVEKLLKQIGDKEVEIDVLIKKSPKDLWETDLDGLIEEWREQLQLELTRTKKAQNKNRRTSAKLGIAGKGAKKRKAADESDDDSDFEFGGGKATKQPPTKKPSRGAGALMDNFVTKKPAGVYPLINGVEQTPVEPPPAETQGLIPAVSKASKATKALAAAAKPIAAAKKKQTVVSDDSDEEMASVTAKAVPAKTALAKKKQTVVPDDSDVEMDKMAEPSDFDDVALAPKASRAAAKKPAPPLDSDDEMLDLNGAANKKPARAAATKKKAGTKLESDDDDDVFGAVEKLAVPATTRGGRAVTKKVASYNDISSDESSLQDGVGDLDKFLKPIPSDGPAKSLISESAQRPSSAHSIKKTATARKPSIDPIDDTDWAGLARGTPAKRAAGLNSYDDEDMEDDSVLLSVRKPVLKTFSNKANGASAKTNGAGKTNGTAAAAAPAKTVAAKRVPAVAASKVLSPAAKAYQAKQAKAGAAVKATAKPAAKKQTTKLPDSDEEDEEIEEPEDDDLANDILSDEDEDMASPAPVKATARPSRRAAAAPKAKSRYVLDDSEEDEEEDEDLSETLDDSE